MSLSAVVIGSTGLVGAHLVDLLLEDPRFGAVTSLSRRPTGKAHPKLQEHVVAFDDRASWERHVRGDVLFSALGTTIRNAGSEEAQRKVDYTYQLEVARAAAAAGVPTYVLVSSPYADPASRIFYSRIKGELERDVAGLGFSRLRILRPSLLEGERPELRVGERVAGVALAALGWIPGLRKLRAIHGRDVARAMIAAALRETAGKVVYEPDELHGLARET